MFTHQRSSYLYLVTPGTQILLFIIAVYVQTPVVWRVCIALIAGLSLISWVVVLRRMRAFTDTPTSVIASAAQGYVELRGRGKRLDGLPLLTPLTNLPCLWYRYHVERRRGDKWVMESRDESDASFVIDDGSGVCVVDPVGAEILPARCDKWQQGDYRYSQWLILEQEAIYVIGGFRTQGARDFEISLSDGMKQILADWKQDRPKLLQRFDLNQDGSLDLREWELARAQARREAERRRNESYKNNDLHFMGPAEDGRLYLISTFSEDKLASRYRLWAWLHVVIFFAALIGLAKISTLSFSG
jgi:hypothetical protein